MKITKIEHANHFDTKCLHCSVSQIVDSLHVTDPNVDPIKNIALLAQVIGEYVAQTIRYDDQQALLLDLARLLVTVVNETNLALAEPASEIPS